MSIPEMLLPEFDQEMATTRRLLERVPSDKGAWKPHLGAFPGYTYQKTETLLRTFDQNVKEARQAIVSSKDADYSAPWSLRHGDQVLFTLPRAAVVRTKLSHLIHHRGQLTVYLRLLDVPIPPIYGPTADEQMPGF